MSECLLRMVGGHFDKVEVPRDSAPLPMSYFFVEERMPGQFVRHEYVLMATVRVDSPHAKYVALYHHEKAEVVKSYAGL